MFICHPDLFMYNHVEPIMYITRKLGTPTTGLPYLSCPWDSKCLQLKHLIDPPGGFDNEILSSLFFIFRKMWIFGIFPWHLESRGFQSMGNGCGLHMNGFSTHFEPSEFISVDFHDFDYFAVVSDCLTLFLEGPRTLRNCPEGTVTLREWVMVV